MIGYIIFNGEPVTLAGEQILSGEETNVELADALAALTGTTTIGGTLDVTNLVIAGTVKAAALPTSNPNVAGQLFTTANVVTKSTG